MLRRAVTIIAIFGALAGLLVSCSPDGPESPTQIIPNQPTGNNAKAVNVSLNRDSIPADGITAVEIRMVCTIDGVAAPAGLPVVIEVDNGDLSLDGVTPINTGTVTRRATITTLGGGLAIIYLISPTNTGIANINVVFADEAADTDFVSFTTPTNLVAKIELILSTNSGEAPLSLEATATVTDADGNTLEGITVDFSIGDNQANISPQRIVTDSSGKAVTLISDISQDTTVTATAVGRTAILPVQITNDSAQGISLIAVGNNADPIIVNSGSNLLVRATVNGESGNVGGKNVRFTITDPGASMNPPTRVSDSSGNADSTAANIRQNSVITARVDNFSSTISVRINTRPVAVLNLISGSAVVGSVSSLTFSAENSFDPEQTFGDTISNYEWAFTMEAALEVPVAVTNTSNDQLRTFVVGEAGGDLPGAGDKLTVFLTVTDSNNLQSTATVTITW